MSNINLPWLDPKDPHYPFPSADDALDREISRIYTYAHLRYDQDTGNTAYMGMQDRIKSRYTDIASQCSWIVPEILAIPDDKLDAFAAEPVMALYERALSLGR